MVSSAHDLTELLKGSSVVRTDRGWRPFEDAGDVIEAEIGVVAQNDDCALRFGQGVEVSPRLVDVGDARHTLACASEALPSA